jgi:hypothetical protein
VRRRIEARRMKTLDMTSASGALLTFVVCLQRACQLGCSVSTAEPAGSGPCSRGETVAHHQQRLQHPQRVPAWGATWNRPCAGGHHRRPAHLLVVRWLARHPRLQGPGPACAGLRVRRRAAQGLAGCGSPKGDPSSESCPRSGSWVGCAAARPGEAELFASPRGPSSTANPAQRGAAVAARRRPAQVLAQMPARVQRRTTAMRHKPPGGPAVPDLP